MNVTNRILIVIGLAALLAACGTAREGADFAALPPEGEPPGFAGMAAQNVRLAFGAPAFVRKDGADEMWRYDGAACKAFFFLYPEGSGLSVRHVETLPRGRQWAADASCLDALRAPASPPVS